MNDTLVAGALFVYLFGCYASIVFGWRMMTRGGDGNSLLLALSLLPMLAGGAIIATADSGIAILVIATVVTMMFRFAVVMLPQDGIQRADE